MKKKLDLRNFGVILIKIIGVILGIALIGGILFVFYNTQIWNLPLGLIGLWKTEPKTVISFGVVLVIAVLALILFNRLGNSIGPDKKN